MTLVDEAILIAHGRLHKPVTTAHLRALVSLLEAVMAANDDRLDVINAMVAAGMRVADAGRCGESLARDGEGL